MYLIYSHEPRRSTPTSELPNLLTPSNFLANEAKRRKLKTKTKPEIVIVDVTKQIEKEKKLAVTGFQGSFKYRNKSMEAEVRSEKKAA